MRSISDVYSFISGSLFVAVANFYDGLFYTRAGGVATGGERHKQDMMMLKSMRFLPPMPPRQVEYLIDPLFKRLPFRLRPWQLYICGGTFPVAETHRSRRSLCSKFEEDGGGVPVDTACIFNPEELPPSRYLDFQSVRKHNGGLVALHRTGWNGDVLHFKPRKHFHDVANAAMIIAMIILAFFPTTVQGARVEQEASADVKSSKDPWEMLEAVVWILGLVTRGIGAAATTLRAYGAYRQYLSVSDVEVEPFGDSELV